MWLGLLCVALLGLSLFAFMPQNGSEPEPTLSDAIRVGVAPRPSVTESTTIDALAETRGFQALVSYTDHGFEPSNISIKRGDTVRFTNNSSGALRINASELAPREFLEMTFDTSGTQTVTNALNAAHTGTIRVE